MSDKKGEKSRRGGRAGDFAKNIWLAGLGAYGEAYDDFANQQKSLKDLPQRFKDLVAKGAGIESSREESARDMKKDAHSEAEHSDGEGLSPPWGSESMEQRIRRMRENLNLNWPSPPTQEIKQLQKKIETLDSEVKEIKALLIKQTAATEKKSRKKSASKKDSP